MGTGTWFYHRILSRRRKRHIWIEFYTAPKFCCNNFQKARIVNYQSKNCEYLRLATKYEAAHSNSISWRGHQFVFAGYSGFFAENRATFLTLLGSHFLCDDEDDSILMFLFMPHVRKTQLYEMGVDYAPCWGQKHYCNSVKMMNMFISTTDIRPTRARQPYQREFSSFGIS